VLLDYRIFGLFHCSVSASAEFQWVYNICSCYFVYYKRVPPRIGAAFKFLTFVLEAVLEKRRFEPDFESFDRKAMFSPSVHDNVFLDTILKIGVSWNSYNK